MNLSPHRLVPAVCALMAVPPALPAGLVPGSKDIGSIWFIGDSITRSNLDGDPDGSPRKSLHDLLVMHGYTFSFTGHATSNPDGLPPTGDSAATNLYHYHSGISGSVIGDNYPGRTGMTSGMPNFWVTGRLATVKPEVILVMLGTNDIDNNIDLATAPERLKTLLNTIHGLTGTARPTIFIASIPPNRTTLPADPLNTAAFNASVPDAVKSLRLRGRDLRYVDQFSPLENTYATSMRVDDLHTNTAGNNLLALQWFNAISSVVNLSPPGSPVAVSGAMASMDTDNSAAAGYATAASFAADVAADDLINAGQPSLLSAGWDRPPAFQTGPVNDGAGHPADAAAGTHLPATFGSGEKMPFTYTAILDTSENTLGYRIETIRSFAGWNRNGASLANQKYELLVSTVAGPDFSSLGIFQYGSFTNSNSQEAGATRMTLTDAGGTIATGVDAIRFVVIDHGFNTGDSGTPGFDGSLLQEIDVIGSPVSIGFEAWAAGKGIPADVDNDEDKDGIPALLEYGLGLDPAAGDGLPSARNDGRRVRITWPKGAQAAVDPRVGYTVEVSSDLDGWLPAAAADLNESPGAITFTFPAGPGPAFARLGVSRSAP